MLNCEAFEHCKQRFLACAEVLLEVHMLGQSTSDVFEYVLQSLLCHLLIQEAFHPGLLAEQVLLVLFGNLLIALHQDGPCAATDAVGDPLASSPFHVARADLLTHLELADHVNPLTAAASVCLKFL